MKRLNPIAMLLCLCAPAAALGRPHPLPAPQSQPDAVAQDPGYRSGQRLRKAGILVAAIGGGVGLGIGGTMTGLSSLCWNNDWTGDYESDKSECKKARNFGIGLLVVGVVSLAVGIPLAVVGNRRMAAARARTKSLLPEVDVVVAGGGARLDVAWRF